jgi:large subunit ribosomal protein L18
MILRSNLKARRRKRHIRVRKKVAGTQAIPRLCVFRSLNHIYVQVIDDENGHTMAATSSLDPEVKANVSEKTKSGVAGLVGSLIAKRAISKGIPQVVFDRGGYKYHGRVKALAEAAREAGLKF